MKIVIVGGGTAGWITAAFFVKYLSNYDITVVDSSKIPIIGAGEGSTGVLPWFIKGDKWPNNMVTEIDFLRKTKATLKLGIRMENWRGDGTSMYSPFHATMTHQEQFDYALHGSHLKYGRGDFASVHSLLLEDRKSTFRKVFGRITAGLDNHSYHFDGVEVGKYFKKLCTQNGVKCVDSEVADLQFDNDEYLQTIKLVDGTILSADMWYDCSGFSKVLMGKTKNKWISYKENLPVNSAIPFSTEIHSKVVRFETLAKTLDAGWMWKIPLQHRHGCGYVYSDEFQSYDNCVDELQKTLRQEIEPIKHIKFEPGRFENAWYKNIAAIGLSSHFLEPLQATSIHIAITSLIYLNQHFLVNKECIKNESDRSTYNKKINVMVDDYKDFIQLHYLSGRSDTPFWKFIQNEMVVTDKNKELLNISKRRLINIQDIQNGHGAPGWPLWSHMIEMAGLYDKDMIKEHIKTYGYQSKVDSAIKDTNDFYSKIKYDLVSNEEFFKYLKI